MTAKTSRTPTASRVVLTDKLLLKLAKRSAEKGKRYDVMDSIVPPFGIRVTDKGHLSYILAARFPGLSALHPQRDRRRRRAHPRQRP